MSNPKKKTIVIDDQKEAKAKLKPTVANKSKQAASKTATSDLLFTRETFKWVGIGIALIAIGMILMMGGHMPSRDVWDESLIYSPVRTLVAPIFILAGLGVQIYAILKK